MPSKRLGTYLIAISYHFHFTPRDIDEFEVAEFDQYAHQCDVMAEEHKKAEQKARRTRR